MPDDTPPPQPPRPGQRRAHPDHSEALPPKRHASQDTQLAGRREALPKKLHFVVDGELTPYQTDYIEVWKRFNPDYEVKVWVDRKSYYERLKFEVVVEKAYGRLAGTAADAIFFDDNERGKVGLLARFREELDRANAEIKRLTEIRGSRNEAIREYLETNGVSKKRLKDIADEQEELLKRLGKHNIEVEKVSKVFDSPVNPNRFRQDYECLAYENNDPLLAQGNCINLKN